MTQIPPTLRGDLVLERRARRCEDGGVALSHAFRGNGTRVLITNTACLLAKVEVVSGSVSFPLASGLVPAPPRFVLWVPPRTLLPVRFQHATVQSEGLGTFEPLRRSPDGAALLRWPEGAPLSTELLRCEPLAQLDADAQLPEAMVRARRLLHESLDQGAPVRGVAAELGLDADALSRAFTRAFGLTPKQYCHRARLFDASLKLLSGATILSAALETGWNDLSRFYAQFRRFLFATPGVYARAGKRQDR
jgi:AraC-like DNA-binding protein